MSRKNKVGIDYFSHDVDMKDDKKIRLIIAKHGLVGYGMYNRLLEEIYRESGYFVIIDPDFKVLFSNDCKIEESEFDIILEDLITRGLFDKSLFDSFGLLTSKRIQENYCSATERRKEVSFVEEYLLVNVVQFYNLDKVDVNINALNANINEENVNINGVDDNINPQRKVKESKGKESIKIIFNEDCREMKISKFLHAVLLKSRPEQKEPNWQTWCKDIHLFLKKHNPTDEEIKKVIIHAHDPANSTESFSWIPNLRSPKKLTKHFETILLQTQTHRPNKEQREADVWREFEQGGSDKGLLEHFK